MQLQLQLQDSAVILSSLTALCVSFCILILALWFRNAGELQRMLGFSFAAVFLFYLAAMTPGQEALSAVFVQTSEPVLLLLFVILLTDGDIKITPFVTRIVMIMVPVLLLMVAIITSESVRDVLSSQLVCLSAHTVLSILLLYLLKKRTDMDLLIKAVFCLLICAFVRFYLWQSLLLVVSPVLKIAAYAMMLHYFYQVYLKMLLATTEDNKKKLSELNRSIESEVKKRILEVERVNQKLVDISKIDAMSQVLNKSALLASMDYMATRKTESEFSILLFDIDNFKEINDTYGHITGDKCIKELASNTKKILRDVDLIGRFGGDEFIVILPGTDSKQSMLIAERFRKHIAASSSPHYTVSIGIACYPSDAHTISTLIEAADKGLYISKQKGRNAVSRLNFY